MAVTIILRLVPKPVPPTLDRIDWGAEIKKLRAGQNMSQRKLAKLAGVDRASLRRFEEGDSRGNIDLVERLAEVLGYELELMHRGYPGGFTEQPELP